MHSEYDSAESIAVSDLEDGELRKMLASPLYLQNRGDCNPLECQSQRRNLLQLYKRERVSAKRTQADRGKGLMSNSSQETCASGKLAAMFSSGSK